jgi:hypothetical protein
MHTEGSDLVCIVIVRMPSEASRALRPLNLEAS